MNTRNFMLVLVTAMVVLSSCGGKMSPYTYNETIVKMHDNSFNYLNEKTDQIFDYKNTPKKHAMQLIDSLNIKFDGYIERLGKMQYPDGADDWHKITTQLFVYTKDSIIPLFSETFNYEPESQEWYNVWNEIDHRMKGRADQIESQMIKEQEKFAETAGERLR